ncbi:glycoside hydrolase family 28 protein [Gramella sp. AN32]|uniref:Glycoside hydrolase family 28 protein n=1 Tax=Christiangramia antarctica TaxID=2058158 RepID=A0ABW5X324_9FLAO|nr:glycoside hydrolase family 28 protein [Gramella sp. AN32]MCM4157265.1 exo-poly-alpha-D-galacturonosidase [Gramella sp. AN32]
MKWYFLLFIISSVLIFSCKNQENEHSSILQQNENNSFRPEWVKKVGAKVYQFEDSTYYVNNFEAVDDGSQLTTEAIQKAIDECAKNGGGMVRFKPGIYLTGSVFIKEGVHFKIDEGVEIRGSEDIKDYPLIDTRIAGIEIEWPAALINVRDQKNVTISGEGLVDGQGKVFWDYYWKLRKEYEPKGLRWIVDYEAQRPRTFLISNAENIFLKDLNIQRAGFWTVQILYSKYVTVDGVIIRNNIGGHGPSTDGIDIDSSQWILVQNCDIDCNDDNFCLKAGRDWDGLRVDKPTEYVVIRDCIARRGAGLFTIGSETSGDIRHVYVSNIEGLGTSNGLNIKSAMTRGGTVEDIYIENIKMDSVGTFMEVSMNWNPSYSYSKLPANYDIDEVPEHWRTLLKRVEPASRGIPKFRDISLYNIKVKNAKQAINVNGIDSSLVENITLKDVSIQAETAGQIHYSKNWELDRVHLKIKDSSQLEIRNSQDVKFSESVYYFK